LRSSQTIRHAGRELAAGFLAKTVVDADETPIGMLGWDDIVRFALAHGSAERWSTQPARDATRPGHAITPVASGHRLEGAVTVGDIARAMLVGAIDLGTQNDALQRWTADGIVTPSDLLRVIFPR
jgi:CBS domain-containing protein